MIKIGKKIKMMKHMSLIKRLLLYVLLLGFFYIVALLVTRLGNIFPIPLLIIFFFLITHYIFGSIFLKTKLIFKLIMPFVIAIVSFGSTILIISFFYHMTDKHVAIVMLLTGVFAWEIAYQILKINPKTEETDEE